MQGKENSGSGLRGNLQLWSYNYDPEPTGIAPVSTCLAHQLRDRGWHVQVVAAHPHYPEPRWGRRLRPYRERRDGVRVLRLPLWVGRDSTGQRMRQEASFTAALLGAIPALGRPDVMLVTSPSFPALAAALVNAKLRSLPWILWLHDLLPDGAISAGLLEEDSLALRGSRRLEAAAYRDSDRIVVLSSAFGENLRARGVPAEKIDLIYDPATREPADVPDEGRFGEPPRILSMGNIGHTQGLAPLVAAFERSSEMAALGSTLVITGNGVAAAGVRAQVRTERVRMLGLVDDRRLDAELRSANLALVSQSYDGTEFNLPSKLMNFMMYGLPVIAAVNPRGEVARIVNESGGGWVADSSDPDSFPRTVARAHADPSEVARRSRAARLFAEKRFASRAFADRFEEVLRPFAGARA
ncbi:MAG TPA: glycosyltransferase family 4 protein [Solirubrobacterales bacterium]